LKPQTVQVFSFIDDLLRVFSRRSADLSLAVCYFKSDGSQETTDVFLATMAACTGGVLPPMTLVPMPHLHTPETTVEIWGVAPGQPM
jgi:hypothetical protein